MQLWALVEMVKQDGDPMPGLEDAYKSLEIVLAGDEVDQDGQNGRLALRREADALGIFRRGEKSAEVQKSGNAEKIPLLPCPRALLLYYCKCKSDLERFLIALSGGFYGK